MEREWKLGVDLNTCDNLLDGVTFDDLILAVHCNSREITQDSIEDELNAMLASRLQDMVYLLENNVEAIIAEARKGRTG